jgi:hypothetical protein
VKEYESDKEKDEDNAIFVGDGAKDEQREYIKNLVIHILQNLGLCHQRKGIKP